MLRGDRIVNTPYDMHMNVEKKCEVLCDKPNKPVKFKIADSKLVVERIREEYYIHLYVKLFLFLLYIDPVQSTYLKRFMLML